MRRFIVTLIHTTADPAVEVQMEVSADNHDTAEGIARRFLKNGSTNWERFDVHEIAV